MSNKGGNGVARAQLDRAVRHRIAEIMSAAGVDRSRVSQELLFELPDGFIKAYELLYDRAVGDGRSGGRDGEGGRGGDAAKAEVGVAGDPDNKGGGSGGRTRDTDRTRERYDEVVVRSGGSARRGSRGAAKGGAAGIRLGEEEALALKARVDKRLRGLGREIMRELGELGLGVDGETGEIMVKVDSERVALLRNSARGDRWSEINESEGSR